MHINWVKIVSVHCALCMLLKVIVRQLRGFSDVLYNLWLFVGFKYNGTCMLLRLAFVTIKDFWHFI